MSQPIQADSTPKSVSLVIGSGELSQWLGPDRSRGQRHKHRLSIIIIIVIIIIITKCSIKIKRRTDNSDLTY